MHQVKKSVNKLHSELNQLILALFEISNCKIEIFPNSEYYQLRSIRVDLLFSTSVLSSRKIASVMISHNFPTFYQPQYI